MSGSIVIPGASIMERRCFATEEGIFRLPDSALPERHTVVMSPSRVFKPYTLLVWGARAETSFRSIVIAGDNQLRTKVPGCLFEAEMTFDEFESLLLRRPDEHYAIVDLERVGQYFHFDMPAVPLGSRIEVEVEGGYDRAVFIGRLPRYGALEAVPREGS